jgi:hypothetical protein
MEPNTQKENKILVRKPQNNTPMRKTDDNIKMGRTEIGCEDVDWILLVQDSSVAGFCEHGELYSPIKKTDKLHLVS